jgi:hypothetical protein
MEWWQTMLIAAVPAAVTAVSVLWTSARAQRREDARRAQESAEREAERSHQRRLAASGHEHEIRKAELEHGHGLRTGWRDERKAAHAEVLAALQSLYSCIRKESGSIWETDVYVAGIDPALYERVAQGKATVGLIGSSGSCEALDAAVDALQAYDLSTFFALVDRVPKEGESEEEAKERKRQNLRESDEARAAAHLAIEQYRRSVREELETER